MLSAWLFLIIGLVILTFGAELLVRGSARLAAMAGISPLVVGLTVVAFGTSTPEMAVSAKAAWLGQADIAVGNVIGSNIFNILFIVGACAVILPLIVHVSLIRFDVPIMVASAVVMWLFSLDGTISRIDGIVCFLGLIAFIAFAVIRGRRESASAPEEFSEEYGKPPRGVGAAVLNVFYVLAGLGLLVWGANWLVRSAVDIANSMLPENSPRELIIGLTIVAAGTSLPEVATSIVATIKGERDIAVGNVVGSNIFNVFGVLGISAAVSPSGIHVTHAALHFDIPFMVAVSIACMPIFFTGNRINRWEGGLFLAYYVAYTAYLLLDALKHESFPAYSVVMVYYVAPLTAVTLLVIGVREVAVRRGVTTAV